MNEATANRAAAVATTEVEYPPPAAVAREVDAVLGLLAVARALVENGRHVDLTGLNDVVGRVCARVLDLGPEQGRRLQPGLDALLTAAAALEAAIRANDFRPMANT